MGLGRARRQTLLKNVERSGPSFEGARLQAAPYIVFKDLRHGWEAMPFQKSNAKSFSATSSVVPQEPEKKSGRQPLRETTPRTSVDERDGDFPTAFAPRMVTLCERLTIFSRHSGEPSPQPRRRRTCQFRRCAAPCGLGNTGFHIHSRPRPPTPLPMVFHSRSGVFRTL